MWLKVSECQFVLFFENFKNKMFVYRMNHLQPINVKLTFFISKTITT